MTVDLDELLESVDGLEEIHPDDRDEVRRRLRTLLANRCVPGPRGGAFLETHSGDLAGHVSDLSLRLNRYGTLRADHEDTNAVTFIDDLEPDWLEAEEASSP